MLVSPEAHERLTGDGWSADRARAAIAGIAADVESTFDDGWSMHPDDVEKGDDPATRFRTVYLGGAGVVDALHRLARRGFVELRREYVPYLERSLEAPPDFPDEDAERSLWCGETGSGWCCSGSRLRRQISRSNHPGRTTVAIIATDVTSLLTI